MHHYVLSLAWHHMDQRMDTHMYVRIRHIPNVNSFVYYIYICVHTQHKHIHMDVHIHTFLYPRACMYMSLSLRHIVNKCTLDVLSMCQSCENTLLIIKSAAMETIYQATTCHITTCKQLTFYTEYNVLLVIAYTYA